MPKDPLEELVDQLRAACPEFPADKLMATAHKIRRDMGGANFYLKKAPVEGKAFCLGNALAGGGTLSEAFDVCGVSRATGFRLLRYRPRR